MEIRIGIFKEMKIHKLKFGQWIITPFQFPRMNGF